jgi:hypothetical protein
MLLVLSVGGSVLEIIAVEFFEDEDGFVIFIFPSKGLSYIHENGKFIIIL